MSCFVVYHTTAYEGCTIDAAYNSLSEEPQHTTLYKTSRFSPPQYRAWKTVFFCSKNSAQRGFCMYLFYRATILWSLLREFVVD